MGLKNAFLCFNAKPSSKFQFRGSLKTVTEALKLSCDRDRRDDKQRKLFQNILHKKYY